MMMITIQKEMIQMSEHQQYGALNAEALTVDQKEIYTRTVI